MAQARGGAALQPLGAWAGHHGIQSAAPAGAICAATPEANLKERGVLGSFSRPRVSNANPCSESQFHTVRYRPDYRSGPFASKAQACEWVASFAEWYNPHHRHRGHAIDTGRQRAQVDEQARPNHPPRSSRSSLCWRQAEVAWINKPPQEPMKPGAVSLPLAA